MEAAPSCCDPKRIRVADIEMGTHDQFRSGTSSYNPYIPPSPGGG